MASSNSENKSPKLVVLGAKSNEYSFFAYGKPAPQGSKRHVGNGILIESSKYVKQWRKTVKTAARKARPKGWNPFLPIDLYALFLFDRPKSHYRTNGQLKPKAPVHCTTRIGDLDKLLRAIADALTDISYKDDSQIINIQSTRRYVRPTEQQGALISLRANQIP